MSDSEARARKAYSMSRLTRSSKIWEELSEVEQGVFLHAPLPHDNEAPEVIQADEEAATTYLNHIEIRKKSGVKVHGVLPCEDGSPHPLALAFARHRLAFASPAEPAPGAGGGIKELCDPTGAPGRVVIGKDDPLYKAFRPRPETIAAIEKNEQANAEGLTAIRDMMVGHVTNWPEPKRFGTAIALVDKTLHAALSIPSLPAGREAIAREARAAMQRLANTRMDMSLADWGDVSSPLFAAIDRLLAIGPSVAGSGECSSCGGLNTSCPAGCERDPKTGELS